MLMGSYIVYSFWGKAGAMNRMTSSSTFSSNFDEKKKKKHPWSFSQMKSHFPYTTGKWEQLPNFSTFPFIIKWMEEKKK